MKKLRNKLFITIFTMMTLFSLCFAALFNYQMYEEEKYDLREAFIKIDSIGEDGGKETDRENAAPEDVARDERQSEPMEAQGDIDDMLLNSSIYNVILDNDGFISEIIGGRDNEGGDSLIRQFVKENIIKNNIYKDAGKIVFGNLYTADCSYMIQKHNKLLVSDNESIRESLTSRLKLSGAALIIIEILILLFARLLTSWIIRPVEEAFSKQKSFIEDASHELKTPLTVIIANAEALDDTAGSKWSQNIKSEAERMNTLVHKLLYLAGIEERARIEYRDEDLSKLVEGCVMTFESIAFEKKLTLEENIEKGIFYKCDGDDIRQLLMILLDNAVDHCSNRGRIEVILKAVKRSVVISIRNTGEAIAKEEEKLIFERFYRSDASRNRDGGHYGLGLAIAKSIVQIYDGEITASSDSGITEFRIVMPV